MKHFKAGMIIIASLLAACSRPVTTPGATETPRTNGQYVLPELSYTYESLEPHLDARTMAIHHGKHHQAYVNNLNTAIKDTPLADLSLEEIFADMSRYPASVRNNGGGHWNHTFFWKILNPAGGGLPQGSLLTALEKRFGSFENFRTAFNQAGASRFGSGWVWLIVDSRGDLQITSTPNQDNPLMDVSEVRGTPILGIDVWEHAYYLLYQNRRGDYLSAVWNVIYWPEVEKRYQSLLK